MAKVRAGVMMRVRVGRRVKVRGYDECHGPGIVSVSVMLRVRGYGVCHGHGQGQSKRRRRRVKVRD